MARWWLARAGATVALEETGDGLAVSVTAPADAPLVGATVELFLPGGGEHGLHLAVDSLAPGETRRLVVRPAGMTAGARWRDS